MRNAWRTVRRICIFISGLEGLIITRSSSYWNGTPLRLLYLYLYYTCSRLGYVFIEIERALWEKLLVQFLDHCRTHFLSETKREISRPKLELCYKMYGKTSYGVSVLRACKLWIKLVFLQIKVHFYENVSKATLYIIKQIKKSKTVLCSVIKHSRSTEACVHPTLLSCSRHFLACFITEQGTVLAFLFLKPTRISICTSFIPQK